MSIRWEPGEIVARDGTTAPAEFGWHDTWVKKSPRLGVLRLRLARLGTGGGRPQVLFLSGGPGDSGIRWATHPPFLAAFRKVSEKVDLILVDQRGSGASQPSTEVESPRLSMDSWTSRALLFEDFRAQAQRELPLFFERGIELPEFHAKASADDLAEIAAELGGEVSLWGYSYGTHLAQAALKYHPGVFQRAVLCGFEGPDQTYKLPERSQAQLEKLAALCEDFDLLAAMRRVHSRLSSEPMVLADGRRVGAFGLKLLTSTWVGVSNRFTNLPKLYASLERGETDMLAQSLTGLHKSWRRPASFYTTDGASGASAARLVRIYRSREQCEFGEALDFPFPAIARSWSAEDLGQKFREPLSSGAPMLVFTGSLDGNTPTENAVESLPLLPNATHKEIRYAAHNDMLSAEGVVEDVAAFLAGEGCSLEPRALPRPRLTI